MANSVLYATYFPPETVLNEESLQWQSCCDDLARNPNAGLGLHGPLTSEMTRRTAGYE